MEKTIRKPKNWQDFESLCKKLWGEIWEIRDTIKINGRLGQEQAGVDIYGIPKGEEKYWGIQCKGKDDYSNARITEAEIINEITKARKFLPELEVYIIATSCNKDAKIEEFIRLKSLESTQQGFFKISLYCWEDIVDLLEDHNDILNWYLNGSGQKGKFGFNISFNNSEDTLTLKPVFEKEITKYRLTNKTTQELVRDGFISSGFLNKDYTSLFSDNRVNNSWCSFELIMENCGSSVIENWQFEIKFIKGVRLIHEEIFSILPLEVFIDNDHKTISYYPFNDKPLIQKTSRFFKVDVLVNRKLEKIFAEWQLLARDFNISGNIEIMIEPQYIENIKYVDVNKIEDIHEDKIKILDYITKS